GGNLEIFPHRQGREYLPTLGNLADAGVADTVARPAGDVGAAKRDAAARGALHARDGADQRGLAGAVPSQDAAEPAFLHIDAEVVQRLRIAVENVDVADRQHHEAASAPR